MAADEFSVTEEQIQFFQENGYLKYGPVLTADELDELRGEVDDFITGRQQPVMRGDLGGNKDVAEGQEKFLQLSGLWKSSDTVRRYALQKRRADIAPRLLGVDSIRLLSDMVLYKPSGGSRTTEWH